MRKQLTAFALACLVLPHAVLAAPALERVNQSNQIRCGYVEYAPALVKDMATGTWSGFDHDIISAVAARLELKADFTTATGWATVVADLDAGKMDMFFSGFWVHPVVSRHTLFSRPAFYQPVFIVARTDDTRFTPSTNLNDPSLTMVVLEGDNSINVAKADFPRAKLLNLPNMTDFPQVLVNVALGKADFTIVDAYTFGEFDKNNPGKLRIVDPRHAIRVYPISYVFKAEDVVFRDAFNAALDELILDGSINRILDHYDSHKGMFYRVTATPYIAP